ncbi:MAG: hypothetical protein AAFR01_00890 [Pseudomonadota bacterium]
MITLKNIAATLIALSLPVLTITAAPALAQEAAAKPVTLKGDVKVVKTSTDDAGNETTQLLDPVEIIPGDRLIFGTDYANNGAEPVTDFVVTNPLPSAVRLAPDANPSLTVSVDGGTTWGTLAELTVTTEQGASRSATHADVTHVRWTLASIAAGETGRLEYPAIIR